MKTKKIYLVVLGCILSMTLIPRAYGFEEIGSADKWRISGADGQCQAGKPLDPHTPSQIAIGISPDGTYMHLQNLRWLLPSTPTNMMPVTVYFDKSIELRTEALLIGQIRAFQVFVWLTDVPDKVFWKDLLAARSMRVTGDFKPGSVKVDLENIAKTVPLLKTCAERFLPAVELPF